MTKGSTPTPASQVTVFDFYSVLKEIKGGRRATRITWNDSDYWLVMSGEQLCLRKPDGNIHPLIVSRGDMEGTDWVLLAD